MFERPEDQEPRLRLAALARQRDPEATLADYDSRSASGDGPHPPAHGGQVGKLVERWVPGGEATAAGARGLLTRRPIVVLLVAALVLAAGLVALGLRSATPQPESPPPLPVAAVSTGPESPATTTTTPTRIVVSVVGKVHQPGLVTLDRGARVADALAAARGARADADITKLNLARKLTDGEQIYVGIPVPPGAAPITGGTAGAGNTSAGAGPLVNLNTATAEQLDTLPGVGPATAKKILDWRAEHGSFRSVSQLLDVSGIGDATLADLKDLVTVG